MTLPPFELHRVRTLEEAGELLDRHGEDAAVYCGGTELLLLLKLGFAVYGHLIDIKAIDELGGLRAEDGTLVIGSTVTHREIERSSAVLERLPALASMERRVANIRVRSVGTLGGNLCFSDPHSDPAAMLLVLDAGVDCRRGGEPVRRLPIADFLVGPYQTALRPGELLVSVRVPLPPPQTGIAHRKVSFHERPAATVAVLVEVTDGAVGRARIAVGSVGASAIRAAEAERALLGKEVTDEDGLAAAAELAAEESAAVEDANGSVAYKENLVRVLVKRCFADAVAQQRRA